MGTRGYGIDPWLVGILLAALPLFALNLGWGLPNGDSSWAADALGPVTTIGIVYRSFAEWNSGWYYFKYPLGYPFLLFFSMVPYLGWLFVTGGWRSPVTEYPYGFAEPEHALFTLALFGRSLNVAFALCVVAVTYGIGKRLLGPSLGLWPARIGAFLVATCYPVIFYAHTTNLDISYLFWLLLALYSAVCASDHFGSSSAVTVKSSLPWAVLGIAAAMAVSSKEQGFALLLPLPIILVVGLIRGEGWSALTSRPVVVMATSAIGAAIVANNVLYNPMGFVGRIAFLLGHPLEPVTVRLAPVEFALWKGHKEWIYAQQVWDGIESTLGWPVVVLALLGAVLTAIRSRRAALWLFVPALSHYYVSLRGLDLITVRYLLPISVIVAVLAGAALVDVYQRLSSNGRSATWAPQLVAVAICLLGFARAVETQWLFATDTRYGAERWFDEHGAVGQVAEYYQKETYVPRFRGKVRGNAIEKSQRNVSGLAERDPEYVVISSASRKSIANMWNPDWRETRSLLKPVPEAQRLLSMLEKEELGYHPVATFRQDPVFLRLRITSLAPEIKIYARK